MIAISYSGVHQAYQMALAAEEAGCLDRFLCSFFDGPGMWGRRLSGLLGEESLRNRRLEGIPIAKVVEHPWPELAFKLRQRMMGVPSNAWIKAAQAFDGWAASQLPKLKSRVIVCSENCARQTFEVAAGLGWRRVYDRPGFGATALQDLAQEAARRCGLPFVSVGDTPEVSRQKEIEISLADVVLAYSESHASGAVACGVPREKIVIVPLWTDPVFWTPSEARESHRNSLRVIFAGSINLRKGVPFLIQAARKLAPQVRLTLVGSLDEDVKPSLTGCEPFADVLPSVPKEKLRDLYRRHDVLVLPSLGDSFGFVALEAMACGLPVVVTSNCGVPVPDESWRVPVMDADEIAQRLELYVDDREQLAADSERARVFAVQFTPERYRQQIQRLYRQLLGTPA